MNTKTKAKSKILETVHESVSDLYNLGFIDKRKMEKVSALCMEPVPQYGSLLMC
jgi:DNA-binding transcriptional regulator YiaG